MPCFFVFAFVFWRAVVKHIPVRHWVRAETGCSCWDLVATARVVSRQEFLFHSGVGVPLNHEASTDQHLETSQRKRAPLGSVGKESTCNTGDLGLIPGLGRSPGAGKGYPLQYSGLENSMDYIVHGVAKSQTRLSIFHFHLKSL